VDWCVYIKVDEHTTSLETSQTKHKFHTSLNAYFSLGITVARD